MNVLVAVKRVPETGGRINLTPDEQAIETRFLGWWGIGLYLFQLGSRRQLDFDLDADGTHVLKNLNRLAQTDHEHARQRVRSEGRSVELHTERLPG